jgi:hypothetical protein
MGDTGEAGALVSLESLDVLVDESFEVGYSLIN